MIVTLTNWDDETFDIKILFWKTHPQKRRYVNGRVLIDTTCRIFLGEEQLSCATAFQSPKDAYNKIIGKKIALTRAISTITSLQSFGCSAAESEHRRLLREAIWLEFHRTFGRWN